MDKRGNIDALARVHSCASFSVKDGEKEIHVEFDDKGKMLRCWGKGRAKHFRRGKGK